MNDERFLRALDRLVDERGAGPGERDLCLVAERVGGRSLAPAADGYCALASTFRGTELVSATPVPALVRGGPSRAARCCRPGRQTSSSPSSCGRPTSTGCCSGSPRRTPPR